MKHKARSGLLSSQQLVRWAYQRADYWRWCIGGRGHTPFCGKANVLERSAANGRRTFVETGTYRGDMLARLMGAFDRLYSIERDPELYRAAVRRFRNSRHVTVYHDDSAVALSRVLAEVIGPCVVWLDAHPISAEPGEVPLLSELRAVLGHRGGGHRVAIDDIRLFSGENGWPSLTEIVILLRRSGRVTHVSVECDMMTFNVGLGDALTEEAR